MIPIPGPSYGGSALVPLESQKFTASGTFTPTYTGWYWVVGMPGGGGGGYDQGGGGSSGRPFAGWVWLTASVGVTVTIGAAGVGATANSAPGTSGGETIFGAYFRTVAAYVGLGGHYNGAGGPAGLGFTPGGKGYSSSEDGPSWGGSTASQNGAGTNLIDFIIAFTQSWTLSRGTGGSKGVPNNGGGGAGGLQVDADSVKGADTVPDNPANKAYGGVGYGGGGAGGDGAGAARNGSAGAPGVLLVEGPVSHPVYGENAAP
jgi:hypothetical protein